MSKPGIVGPRAWSWIIRSGIILIAQVLLLLILSAWSSGVSVDTFGTGALAVLVIGLLTPEAAEGAAFEELIGFHGGIGGLQSKPFILAPVSMDAPDLTIVGAEQVHRLFQGWMTELREEARVVTS